MARSSAGESVTFRVVRVLSSFDVDRPLLSVSEIARRAELPVATAHRIVGELVQHRLLERRGTSVTVGVRLWEIASRGSHTLTLREAARPFMEDLHAAVREHIQLGVLDGDEVLYLERLSAPASTLNETRVAGRMPVHACSSGLVLLAYSPQIHQDELLTRTLPAYTPATITDPQQLRRVLAQVRAQRHVVAAGHITPASLGVAVPVHGPGGNVVAALSAVLPVGYSTPLSLVPALTAAARGITRSMGAARR